MSKRFKKLMVILTMIVICQLAGCTVIITVGEESSDSLEQEEKKETEKNSQTEEKVETEETEGIAVTEVSEVADVKNTETATVVKKEHKEERVFVSAATKTPHIFPEKFLITVQYKNGKREEFEVTKEKFDELEKGDKIEMIIVYKEWWGSKYDFPE